MTHAYHHSTWGGVKWRHEDKKAKVILVIEFEASLDYNLPLRKRKERELNTQNHLTYFSLYIPKMNLPETGLAMRASNASYLGS